MVKNVTVHSSASVESAGQEDAVLLGLHVGDGWTFMKMTIDDAREVSNYLARAADAAEKALDEQKTRTLDK